MISLLGYELEEQIDEDRAASVYRGRQSTSGERVIVKILKDDFPALADLARLKQEYELPPDLPATMLLRPLALEKQGRALVFEDPGWPTLAEIVAMRPPDLTLFLRGGCRLAEALDQVHAQGLLHCNIQPGVIFMNAATGDVKLAGLGHALRRASGKTGPFEGNLAYVSPEQTGRMTLPVDKRSDLYSLGAVLYEWLAGRPPFTATDPLELVHSHIARLPPSPIEFVPDLPAQVAAILLKLLAKTAEARYQDAHALAADLAACLRAWESGRAITEFPLARYDLAGRLRTPGHLYGRQQELARLLDAYQRVVGGAMEVVLIAGYAGIGKSAVVHELQRQVAHRPGYFLKGKFDQYQRMIPYAALIQAFQGLVRRVIGSGEAEVEVWRSRLLAALGPNGRVITDVIPDVQRIIGTPPEIPALGPLEAENRFHRVFEQFIWASAPPGSPLTIFLDDLQWADAGTLKLLGRLIAGADHGHLLIIGAYRENEVGTDHPLAALFAELEQGRAAVSRLKMQPLEGRDLNQLVADALQCPPDRSRQLSALLARKTEGNPLFLLQLMQALYQDDLFRFDYVRIEWQWDLAQLRDMNITDNVVDLMIDRIREVPAETQAMLQTAACIGDRFDVRTLAIVQAQPPAQIIQALSPAVHLGLVLPGKARPTADADAQAASVAGRPADANFTYQFLHDRVQQAAYSLIAEEHRPVVHLAIGRALLANADMGTEREERLFDIVNHLNAGADQIESPAERHELAWLDLAAGRKAKASAAYRVAGQYLASGIRLLPADSWRSAYDLSLALYVEAAEAAYASADFARSDALAGLVLEHAAGLLDRVRVYELQMQSYISRNEMLAAVDVGLQVLDALNLSLTGDTSSGEPELPDLAELDRLPLMQTPEHLAAMRIMVALAPPAFQTRPDIFPQVIRRQVRYSIEHGLSPLAAVSYGLYGFFLLAGPAADLAAGYRAGQLALRLLERFAARELQSKVTFIFNGHIRHWCEPARATIGPLSDGIQSGLETGDLQFVGYNAKDLCTHLFFMGEPLETVAQRQTQYIDLLRSLRQEHSTYYIQVWHQAVLNLQGHSPDPRRLVGASFDFEAMLPQLIQTNNRNLLYIAYLAEAMLCYLFGDHEAAIALARLALPHEESSAGLMNVGMHTQYHALALLAHYPQADPAARPAYLAQVQASLDKMRLWAPANYQHACKLVEAEMAGVLNQTAKAMALYDQSIASAVQNGYVNIEALANERAGVFYLALGREKIAQLYLRAAHHAYLRWGAGAKANDLAAHYPALLDAPAPQAAPPAHGVTRAEAGSADSLDMLTVLKAAQAISSEIVLDRLLVKLIKIVIENAGAEKGALILEQEGRLAIQALGWAEQELVTVLRGTPIEQSPDVSAKIIDYVWLSEEGLVIPNVGQDDRFAGDPYIHRAQPKSVLCLPIQSHGRRVGVWYLENRLSIGAFTPQHVRTLQILSPQVVISLENARLYRQVTQEMQERQQAEAQREAALEALRRSEMELRQLNEHLAGYSRDLDLENTRLRQEVELAAVMRERSRLARELHDSVTQQLYSLTLLAEGWRRLSQNGKLDGKQDYLAELGAIAQQALKEMRLLVHELRPSALEQDGLLGALHRRLEAVELRAGVAARLVADDLIDLPAPIEEEMYRIIQEALNNALKHSAATEVTVRVGMTGGEVIAEISDNGVGFEHAIAASHGGLGLVSMQERADKLGGRLAVDSAPNEGTRVALRVPVS